MRILVSLALALALVFCPALNGQTQQQSAPTNAPRRPAEAPKVVLPPSRVRADEYREQAARIIGEIATVMAPKRKSGRSSI